MSKTTPTELTATPEAEVLMQEFALAEAQLQQAKDAMAPLRKKLLAMFPADEVGNFQINAGRWQLDIEFPDKIVWSVEFLSAYYGDAMPLHVKRAFNITETDFKRLSTTEREGIAGAREQKVGSPKISLIVNKAA